MVLRILELFSGIGGMHQAFQYAQLTGHIVAAMDINTVANEVYKHNMTPPTKLLNNNIQSLSVRDVEKLDVNMIVMSPPCQPHTRVGHQRDIADSRSDALKHLCTLLPLCNGIRYVLMENVKGFECSQARINFIESLQQAGFFWREFLLSPTQFGVPNTRLRYYCIARKDKDFLFSGANIWKEMPSGCQHLFSQPKMTIAKLLEPEETIPASAYLPKEVLIKRVWLLDIVNADANNTMCFTKAYTHYSEGTGSIFTPLTAAETKHTFEQIKLLEESKEISEECEVERMKLLNCLRLRYFTPREVARLMSFPESFSFPISTTNRQKYRLLGNSVNIRVVGELIKLLCS